MRPTQADILNQPRCSELHSVLELRFANTGIAVANLRVAVTQQIQQDGQMRAVGSQRPGVVGVRRWFYRTSPHRTDARSGLRSSWGAVGVTHVGAGHPDSADQAEGVPHGRIWASCGNGDMMKRVSGEASWLAGLPWTDLMQCGYWREGQRRETEGVDEFAASCCLKVLDIRARRAEAGR